MDESGLFELLRTKYSRYVLLPLFSFLVHYRRTALGPAWLLVGPSLFIALLGFLYAEIGGIKTSVFIPHLAVGIVVWTLISGFVVGSATVYQRARAQIMQGGQTRDEVVVVEVVTTVLTFLHQLPIVIIVFLVYKVPVSLYALTSLIGLGFIIANGIWFTRFFGILGVRYRDLSEVFQAVMRIAFLATPIIWMPGNGGRASFVDQYSVFNPFYHFLEIIRAPLLGQSIETFTWTVVLAVTLFGFLITRLLAVRYGRFVPLWL